MDKKLKQFLVRSNAAGYASGANKNWKKEKDGSTSIKFEYGEYMMHDNFFGGEPYGGRGVVFYKSKPYWIMVYYGAIEKGEDNKEIYKFLKESLKEMPDDAPYRGPQVHKVGDWRYENQWEGDAQCFKGEEKILKDGKRVYWARYMGGLVDQN